MKSKQKILSILLLSCMLAIHAFNAKALDADFFTQNSKLASGTWVKIKITENGVYEITYDELRQMGFENPENVGIYGRGGEEQPTQFSGDASQEPYTDDIAPVAVLHKDNKIYFYGQGPVRIRYKYELTNPSTQRFVRHSINTYSQFGYYFLTDDRTDVLNIADATGTINSEKTPITECWDYFYHEKDLVNINKSGQVFLGESMADEADRTLKIPYSIPGALPLTSGSLECRFAANNGTGSQFQFGFENAMIAASISSCMSYTTYMFADPTKKEISLPSAQGEIILKYAPSGQVTMANLDYVILGAKKTIGFFDQQNQFRAFIPNYSTSNNGYITISNASPSTIAWDVTNSAQVVNLPIEYADGVANAMYLTQSKKDGMMMVFDTEKTQMKIAGYETIQNQNIHASETPHLLIITTPSLHQKAEELAQIHRLYDKIDVLVLNSDEIINEFSAGTPDAMAYRAICKMFYDRNPEKFKNLLLFGQYHFDNRQITFDTPHENLISYQTPESRIYDQTFNVGDYYGMLSDNYTLSQTGSNLYNREIHIGVGHLPCSSTADADIVINKISQYIIDNSFAYWLANMQYIADGWDDNEHQGQCEDLCNQINTLSPGQFITNKVYLNAYKKGDDKLKMLQNFDNGMLLSTYFGHGSVSGLSMAQTLWYRKDVRLLKNNRLTFMNVAGCTVTGSDMGIRGSTEAMLFAENYGIIGGMMTNRSAYSTQNYFFMSKFNELCLLENPKESMTTPLSSKRTIGEMYAKTKTNLTTSMNEYAYQLISDPAIVLPLPTTAIAVENITIDGTTYSEDFKVIPGAEMEISGSIVDRQGSRLDDFNGTLVARICDAPVTLKTMGNYSAAIDVTYDETILSTTDLNVVNGKFKGKIILPRNLQPTSENFASLRLSAYDTDSRTASAGIVKISVSQYDETKIVADNTAPTVDAMYINSSDFQEGDIVAPQIMLYASVSDDIAMKFATSDISSDLQLILDESYRFENVTAYASLADGGKTLNLSIPIQNLELGYHSLRLEATDLVGNKTDHSISFRVFEGEIGGELQIQNSVTRQSATITMTLSNPDVDQTAKLYIADALGNIVFSDEISSADFVWNYTDNNGNRVPEGLYYAHAKLDASTIIKGVTPPAKIVVLKEK